MWLPFSQTHGQTDAGQSDPFVPICFAGDTKRNIPAQTHLTLKYLNMLWATREGIAECFAVLPIHNVNVNWHILIALYEVIQSTGSVICYIFIWNNFDDYMYIEQCNRRKVSYSPISNIKCRKHRTSSIRMMVDRSLFVLIFSIDDFKKIRNFHRRLNYLSCY